MRQAKTCPVSTESYCELYLFKFQNLSGVQVCEEKQLLKAIRQSNTI